MAYYIGSTVMRDGRHPFRVEITQTDDTIVIDVSRITVSETQLKFGGYDQGPMVTSFTVDLGVPENK